MDFAVVENLLEGISPPHGDVIWFHGRTEGTGALALPAVAFWPSASMLRGTLGPDLIFADSGLAFGLSFEVQENESVLRLWGELWAPVHRVLLGAS